MGSAEESVAESHPTSASTAEEVVEVETSAPAAELSTAPAAPSANPGSDVGDDGDAIEPELLDIVNTDPQPPFDRNRILVNWRVGEGDFAWSPWGENGWSAVEILTVSKRKVKGKATRVDPVSGDARGKFGGATVKLDRLVDRDPLEQGRDRPPPPSEVFHVTEVAVEIPPPESAPPAHPIKPNEPAQTAEPSSDQTSRIVKLFQLLEDDATIDDW